MAAEIWVVIEYIIKIGAMGVVPENRRPASSSAWLLLILFLPLVGLPPSKRANQHCLRPKRQPPRRASRYKS